MNITHRCSPHADERPEGTMPDLVVIHGISLPEGIYGGTEIDDLFMGRLLQPPDSRPDLADLAGLRVSSHFLVRRDGEVLQYVEPTRRAWHAGVSTFQGRPGCNDFSVGIELEGCDHGPYNDIQYQALVELLSDLKLALPSLAHVAGHCHIAPGRKTDPGPHFEWERLALALRDAGISLATPSL